jgi:hypothetical protein
VAGAALDEGRDGGHDEREHRKQDEEAVCALDGKTAG